MTDDGKETLREWLDEHGFDWNNGTIIYQGVDDEAYCNGWGLPTNAAVITHDHPVLDHRFEPGYGCPEAPRIIAKDSTAIYFCCQYDGSTWLEKVMTDITYYLTPEHPAPYPGG